MTFVTAGLAVAGVVATVVPILIFLLWRQRRSPVEWAAMRFLIEAYRRHRRRLQVEQLLLLAIRCLILVLLGLALARPLLEGTGLLDGGGARLVYVVIDDGVASAAMLEPDEPALRRQVEGAVEIVEALDAGDRVALITAARPARLLLSPPSSDHGAVIELLESLRPSAAPSDLPAALDRLESSLEDLESDHDQAIVYLLSEFRSGSARLDEALSSRLADLGDRVALLAAPPATAPVTNVQITAVEPARSLVLPGTFDGSGQVTVRLARQGGELGSLVSRVRLEGEDLSRVEPKTVEWQPGQTEARVEFVLDFAAQRGREAGIRASIDEDNLAADNERFAVLALRKQIRIVLVERRSFGFEPALDRLTSGQWIRRALAPSDDGPLDVITVEPASLVVADVRTADVVVLPRPDLLPDGAWPILREFVDKGGLLVVTPPAELTVHQWTDHLREDLGLAWQLAREVREHPEGLVLAEDQPASALLRMISSDLSELLRPVIVHRVLPVEPTQTRAQNVLLGADGSPLMITGTPRDESEQDDDGAAQAQGMVVYLAVAPDLDWSNLPGKPLMVPLFHETLRQGLSLIRSRGPVTAGGRSPLVVGPAATALRSPRGERIDLDAANRPQRELAECGLYRVVDGADQEIGTVAVNVDPAAARTDPQPAGAVEAWLGGSGPWSLIEGGDATAALARVEGASPLAGMLLLAALALIILETVLARIFSHAYQQGSATAALGIRATMLEPGASRGRADGRAPRLGGAR